MLVEAIGGLIDRVVRSLIVGSRLFVPWLGYAVGVGWPDIYLIRACATCLVRTGVASQIETGVSIVPIVPLQKSHLSLEICDLERRWNVSSNLKEGMTADDYMHLLGKSG